MRYARFALVAALGFLGLGLVWTMVFGVLSDGGECSFEEVECGRVGEFVDSGAFVALTLPLVVVGALVIAWLAVLRRR